MSMLSVLTRPLRRTAASHVTYEPTSDASPAIAVDLEPPCPDTCTHPWVYAYSRTRQCWYAMRACGCAWVYRTCEPGKEVSLADARRLCDVLNRIYGLQQ